MNINKRKSKAVVFYVLTLVLAVFLLGQVVLVSLYGPKGVIIDLGINGYPDYIALGQVVSGDKPSINKDYAPTAENKDSLINAVKESSLMFYTANDDMLVDFVTGNMQFKAATTIYSSVSLDGGELASMYKWIGEHKGIVASVISDYTLDSNITIESVDVSRGVDAVNLEYIVSMSKSDLVNRLQISSENKEYLLELIKCDKMYITLKFSGELSGGKIVRVEDTSVSLSKANPSMSKVLVDYIDSNSDGMFDGIIREYCTALNVLGKLSVSANRLVISNS